VMNETFSKIAFGYLLSASAEVDKLR
jgi:hypothetical protein